MKREQLYFRTEDSETCHSLEYHLDDARAEGLTEITLLKAEKPPHDYGYVWCSLWDAVEHDQCGKRQCDSWKPRRDGKRGCEHKGRICVHGESETFKVEQQ